MTGEQTWLQQARAAIKRGDQDEARRLLERAVRISPNDYRAWLWLAGVTPSAQASAAYLERAAALNPQDTTVQKARQWAARRLVAETAAPPPPPVSTQTAPTRRGYGLTAILVILFCLLGIGLGLVAWRWLQPTVVPGAVAAADVAHPSVVATVPAQVDTLPPEETDSGGETDVMEIADATAIPTVEDGMVEAPTTAVDVREQEAQGGAGMPAKSINPATNTRPTWTPTPIPSPTPTPTPVPTATPIPPTPVPVTSVGGIPVSSGETWVDVNLTTQTLVAYRGTEPVFTTLISSGTWSHPTVTGQFRIYLRYEAQDMNGYLLGYDYYLPNVPYVMYFYEDYALHGTYWHNNFGTPMSHGCVNLATGDAQWLYNFTSIGTLVSVHY